MLNFNHKIRKYLFFWLTPLLLSCIWLIAYFQPIDLTVIDLGRHLKNGELILERQFDVLSTNAYAVDHANFPFVNHHWLSGVLFFSIFHVFNWLGLHLFYGGILLICFFLFWQSLRPRQLPFLSVCVGIVAAILWMIRLEIRPEGIGLLFLLLELALINHWQQEKTNRISIRSIGLFILIQFLWINFHLSFWLGLWILGGYLVSKLLVEHQINSRLWFLLSGCLLVSLLNPHGLTGLLYPFNVFTNYEYQLVENQTPWFLKTRLSLPSIWLLLWSWFAAASLFLFSVLHRLMNQSKTAREPGHWLFSHFLWATGLLLGWTALRSATLFIVLVAPTVVQTLHLIIRAVPTHLLNLPTKIVDQLKISLGWSIWAAIIFLVASGHFEMGIGLQNMGLGLDQQTAIEIGMVTKLFPSNLGQESVKLFNNYDIGSFGIFALPKTVTVYVDNRPEAYPSGFFADYIALQSNPTAWKQATNSHQFNWVLFGTRDQTPWGRSFTQFIQQDEDWEVMFKDERIIILRRKSGTVPS